MNILGVEFAPLRIPLHRRLQTLAAAAWFITLAFGSLILGIILPLYLILCTRLWWITILYLIWVYLDRNTGRQGGRSIQWVRSWSWWFYHRDYYPLHLAKVPNCELNPEKNYMFCCFPHGMLSTGAFNAFATNWSGYEKLFPNHKPNIVTLDQHYSMPFYRELALSLGGISSTADSISYVLSRKGGGRIVVIMPGGAAEAYFCKPGQYKLLLKKRKGFVRLALQNGTPLVPVISFGETDIFTQFEGPKLRQFQEFLRKYIGFAPVLPLGRGFFQYSFGIIPQRREITTLGANAKLFFVNNLLFCSW